MRNNFPYTQLAALGAFALVFLAVSYLAQRYHAELAFVIQQGGAFGIVGFVILTAIFVVFVIPLDIAFLVPVGAAVFGPVLTALMSITGWTIGAAIAFGIARLFGRPVVECLIGLERVRMVERRIPKRNLFWSVVILRMLISVDILSYALGLVSDMSWGSYVLATLLGVAPFGFFLAYTGALPLPYRFISVSVAVLLATFALMKYGVERDP